MTTGYLFLGEDRFHVTGAEQAVVPPAGATHYRATAYSGGGAGGNAAQGNAVGAGGGCPAPSRNKLRAVPTTLVVYGGRGGQPSFDMTGTSPGSSGEDTYLKEDGIKVLVAQGGQGGQGMANVTLSSGNCSEGGGGGNHDHVAIGDYVASGASGKPGMLMANIRVMGGGGDAPAVSAGGKSSTSAGPGHGPGGGALTYGGLGPYLGAAGADGFIDVEWYAEQVIG